MPTLNPIVEGSITFTTSELEKYVAKHSYEWALDALIETLRISKTAGTEVAMIYLRETMWKHSSPDG